MLSNRVLSFYPLLSFYPTMYNDSVDRGFRGLNADTFMTFVVIVVSGSYGVTSRGCCGLLFRGITGSNMRSIGYRLKFLCDSGYVVKFYHKGKCRYKISIHAEKLISKSLGKESLRDMASYVRSCLKE